MNSGLFVGKVSHRRKSPFRHELRFRTYSLLVDLDEVGDLAGRNRWFSHNRWNLFSLYDRDHGAGDGTPPREWIDAHLAEAGIDLTGGRVEVLVYPRVLGYQFNPLAIWFCRDGDDQLKAVLYEIHNTFGHKHSHLVPIDGNEPHQHSFDKKLHVSPFFDRDGGYSFTLRPPGKRFSVSIDYSTKEQDRLTATLVGTRRELTDRNLLRVFVTHPLLTFKVIAGIHWHALRILLKGGRYHPVPDEPETAVRIEKEAVTT